MKMKTLHLSIILSVMIIFLGFGLESAHADNASGVYIQNIQVKPSVIKVGDTFTVTSTFVNNSTSTIVVNGGTCVPVRYDTVPLFDVTLDDHAKYNTQNWTCAGVGLSKILDVGKNITRTSPDSTVTYVAIKPGTSSITVTYSYHTINQTDPTQSGAEQTISKTFQFVISDNKTSVQPSSLGGPSFTFDKISPLQQFKSGVTALDVKCKTDLILVIKTSDHSPACVKSNAIIPLILRGWAIGSPSHDMVYFVKSNATAQIFVKFTSNRSIGPGPAQPISLDPKFYTFGPNSGYPTDAINVTVTPNSVSLGSIVLTTYTITSQNAASGIYWLSVDDPCDSIPVAVNLKLSDITRSDLQSPTASWKCPGSLVQYHIVGVNGMTIGLVSNESLQSQ